MAEKLFDPSRFLTWGKATTIKVLQRFALVAGATLGTAGVGLISVDWVGVLDVAGLAALLSLLGSIASYPKTDN